MCRNRNAYNFTATRSRTLLVGERATLADVSLACAARDVLESTARMLGPKDLAGVPHVLRWYRTVTHDPAFSTPSGAAGAAAAAAAPKAAKKSQQKKGAAAAAAKGKPLVIPTVASAGGPAAGSTARGLPARGGDAGEDPLPVVGDDGGDLRTSASVVQGARRLEMAPARFRRKRVRVRELLGNGRALIGRKAVVKGWLRTARSASKGALLFLVIDDGSCSETVQVCVWGGGGGGCMTSVWGTGVLIDVVYRSQELRLFPIQ